jgi:putative ABC transport system permease protein
MGILERIPGPDRALRHEATLPELTARGEGGLRQMMLHFAWQNLVTRPTRTLLAVVGLTIPILAILGLFSLTNGIRTLMGHTLARMNGLMVMRANAPAPIFSDLPADMADTLRKIPGTRVVAPEVWKVCPPIDGRNMLARAASKFLAGQGAAKFSSFAETIMVEGQQLPEHLHLQSGVYEQGILPAEKGGGRFLQLSDVGQPNVLISTKIARDYPNSDRTPKKVGDSISIGGKPFQVIGIYHTDSFLIDGTVVMEITTARRLLNVDEKTVSAFYVEPKPFTDLNLLSNRIARAVDSVQVRSMSQFNVQVGNIMGKLDLFLLMTVGLALLVGGVGIANTMLMSAMERFVEFGVMRANGWTRRNILGLVTAESALLGLLSGLVACLLAFAGVAIINAFLTRYELRLELTPELIAASIITALLIATVAGLYPAWRASRMTPMDAIRNEAS